MNLRKLTIAGIVAAGASVVATAANADCTATIKDNKGKVISDDSFVITKQMASGPKQAWEKRCVPFGVKEFKEALNAAVRKGATQKELNGYSAKIEMVCTGSWKGKWCTELKLNGSEYAAGLGKKADWTTDDSAKKTKLAVASTGGSTTAQFTQVQRVRPAVKEETSDLPIVGNWTFRAAKCECSR